MKKLIISALALTLVGGAFSAQAQDAKAEAAAAKAAQKELTNNLKQAKKLYSDAEKPNIAAAREQIAAAMKNSQYKANEADVLFEAANVEYACFDIERNKPAKGGTMDEPTIYAATEKAYDYYTQAYNAYNTPDAKGKTNPKNNKAIAEKAWTLFSATGGFRANAGYAYSQQDWAAAHKYFDMSLKATDAQLTKDYLKANPLAEVEYGFYDADSTRTQTKFNRAVTSVYLENHKAAIEELAMIKDKGYETNVVYQELCRQYVAVGDSEAFKNLLVEGIKVMPNEPWYSQNLMNIYLDNKDYDGAALIIDDIIKADPENPAYINLKGQLVELQGDNDSAQGYFEKALSLDPTNGDINSNLGRVWYNKAADIENQYFDKRQYEKADTESMPVYLKALKYYESAFAFDTDRSDKTIANAMRTILYKQFGKPNCPNKQELIDQYNEVSVAYGLPEFKR